MARLPQPGGDSGNWGAILNDFLSAAHKSDGSIKDDIIGETQLAPAVVTKLNTIAGQSGATGATGPQGPAGTNGTNGATGAAGASGIPGTLGATGATGSQGTQGIQGASGTQGVQGNPGAQGATGPQGPQGTTGATGTNGATGATGPAGADGTSVTITGTVANAAALPTNLNSGDAGKGYLTQDDGHLHVWSGSAWTDVGVVRGPQGATGAQGTQGTQGATGANGATGPTGGAGTQGATGVQGPAGNAGAQGATGPAGTTGGLGATGATGPAGTSGATGASGVAGATGASGPGNLTTTTVKTANYTTLANEYVPVNTTSGAVTITLPIAPADGTQVGVKLVAGTNNCVISRGGTDVFNIASGATTLTLSTVGIGVTLRYSTTGGIWYSMDATPLSALNGSFAPAAGPVPSAYAASNDVRFVSALPGRKVTDFTLALTDAGTIIEAEASTNLTVTVPPASSVAFVDNTLIEICQTGDGRVTLAPGSGVTLRAPGGLSTRAQWSSLSLRRRPGSGSTLPTANMLMRFKADDLTGANGSAVSSWPESSGNGLPAATQGTTANQPTLVTNAINGHKAVFFDGVNDFLQLSGSALDVARNRTELTVFIVYMYPSAFNGTRSFLYLSSGTSSTNTRLSVSLKDSSGAIGAGGRRLDSDSVGFTSGSTGPTAGEVAVVTARFVYSASDLYVYRNGTLLTSNTNFQTTGATSNTSSLAGVIGANLTGAAENLPGRIAEILVYGVDDANMRAAVHTYVQNTYGISVADATGVTDEWVISGDTAT